MREIDQVRITLLRMFRGAVQLPQEIIDEMLIGPDLKFLLTDSLFPDLYCC